MNRNGTLVRRKYREYLMSTMAFTLSIYIASIVDGILVGRLIGPESFSAINLTMPVVYFKNIIFCLFITGGSIVTAQKMGERDTAGTDKIFTLSLLGAVTVAILYAIAGCLTASPLAGLLAGKSSLYEEVYAYLIPLWIVGPIIYFSNGTAAYLRLEGWHKLATSIPIVANIINLSCDYIFIHFFGWGIAGAGWATVFGYTCSFSLLIPYYRSRSRSLHFTWVRPTDLKLLKGMFGVGLSAAIIQLCSLLKSYTINGIVINALGDIGSQLISLVNAALMYALMFAEGASNSMASVSGALYGERDGKGLKHLFRTALSVTFAFCFVIFTVLELLPVQFAMLYNVRSPEVLQYAAPVLPIAAVSILAIAPVYVIMCHYQATKQAKAATLLSALQGAVLLIPLFFIMSLAGGNTMWFAYTVAPVLSLFIIITMMTEKSKKEGYDNFLMIPKPASSKSVELSIDCTVEAAETASNRIIDYCRGCGLSGSQGNAFGVAVEELCVNISRWAGLKSDEQIDLFFTVHGDECILKIRDNGKAFNPVEFYDDNEERITGLKLVRNLFDSIEYSRVIGFNITMITSKKEG